MKLTTLTRRVSQAAATLFAVVLGLAAPAAFATDPIAMDDTYPVSLTRWGVDVRLNDSDPDGDPLTVIAVTDGATGTTAIQDGLIFYTPGPASDGNDTFTYTVDDGFGGQATATVTVTNNAPDAMSDTYHVGQLAYGGAVLVNDGDADGDPIWIESYTDGAEGYVMQFEGRLYYFVGPSGDGNDTFTYTITDGFGGRATATVTVTNNAPDAMSDTYHVGQLAYGGAVLVNDGDADGDPIWIESYTDGAEGYVMQFEGRLYYFVGPSGDGNDTFTYTITDGFGGRATATVTVTNNAPDAMSDTYHVGQLAFGGAVLVNDGDADGNPIWIESFTDGAEGYVMQSEGRLYYFVGPSGDGNDTFTYTITDGFGGRATTTVTVANSAPVALNDTRHVTSENPVIDVLANDSDPDGNPVWIESVTDGAEGSVMLSYGVFGPELMYLAGPSSDGNDTFTYTITDGFGGRSTATVTLVNAAPVAMNDTFHVSQLIDGGEVLLNDSDVEGDTLRIESTTDGAKGGTGTTGTRVLYYPSPESDGNDTFTYTVVDSAGGRATATVTVTNAIPVAQNDTATTAEDVAVNIAVRSNDSDADLSELFVESAGEGAHGSVTTDGLVVTYTPEADWSGTDSFVYTVTDNSGGRATATVTVTVTPANDLPMAVADNGTTVEDIAVSIGVLANDSDIDGDTLGIQSVTQGAHGAVSIAGTNVSYTPAANWNGTDSFTYTLGDGHGGTATATVSVTVTAVNDAPVAAADSATTVEDNVATIAVLSNDSDPENDNFSIQSVTQGTNGAVAINGTNVTYTPVENWSGTDSFNYTIADGNGGTAIGTVTVTVTPANDAPVFTANPFTKPAATIGVPYSASIAGNAADLDTNDTLTFSKVAGPAWLNVATSGALSGVAPGGSSGDNSFTVRVTDAGGLSADATLVITVSGSLPAGWAGSDIGGVGVPGGATESNGTFTVSGSGAGITGTADGFHFVSDSLTGDGEIRARVTSQTNTNPWAKAGVMIRESVAADSKHALMVITPGNGFAFEYRSATAGANSSVAGSALNTVPNNWVRLTRSGTLITAYASANGTAWTQVGTAVVSMASTVEVGLAVTSADNAVLSTATFDNVSVTQFPAPWQIVQIGSPGLQGSAEYFNSEFTAKGAGNLSGSADNVSYVYQTLSGNGEIKARITTPGTTGGANARLGVMVRETLTTGSRYVFMGVNGNSGYTWQRRNSTGGSISSLTSGSGTAPNIWVRVVRSGNTLYGYKSTNSVSWTLVDSRNISMATNIYVGFVVASGSTSTLNTTGFDNVTVVP